MYSREDDQFSTDIVDFLSISMRCARLPGGENVFKNKGRNGVSKKGRSESKRKTQRKEEHRRTPVAGRQMQQHT
jgi:hypothetical protein